MAVPSKNQKSAMVKTSPTKGSQGDKNHKRYLDVDLVLHFEMTFIYSYIIIYIYIQMTFFSLSQDISLCATLLSA